MSKHISLEEYRRKVERRQGSWSPPTEFKQHFQIMSWDQTLSKTGWVSFWMDGTKPVVTDRGMFRPESLRDSFMGHYDRVRKLRDMFLTALQVHTVEGVVLEMPPVGGYRIESSLLAGFAAVDALTQYGMPMRLMSAQHARLVLCGPGKGNDKSAMQAYVKTRSEGSRWNEDQRDALGNGMAHLHELETMGEEAWTPPLEQTFVERNGR